jgi:hypothetical protein
MTDHLILFSHGFGVYADDRGLFPDIAAGLPDTTPIMFGYNRSEANDTLIASTLEEQVEILRQVYTDTRTNNPNATIDLICHSQGCVIAAMAQLEGVRKTIFLAPPDDTFGQNVDEKIQDVTKRKMRPGTKVFEDGSISYPRRDGSTTVIPREYWDSRSNVKPIQLYLALAEKTKLIIVQATNDEVIGMTDFSELPSTIKIIQMDTGHDFEGEDRQKIAELVSKELSI